MNAQDVLDLNQRIHHWMESYHQELEKDIAHWVRKHAIGRSDDLARSFEKLTEENRLLQIGVVGRVKAGKSSLLNALIFDGHNILPQAATPMTAALTTLTHAESFGAQVQFYSAADLDDIRMNAERFDARLVEERDKAADAQRQRRQRTGPMEEDEQFWKYVKNTARCAMQAEHSLAAAHDQWQRINAFGVDRSTLDKLGQLQAEDARSLASHLLEYVGKDGRYMPLTKSVDIFLPLESLRNVRIIDTPGLNDPVQSREERTSKLLKDCDVVFIISPAGQFLSEQDLEVMSRITQKEGVQELVLIASQVDTQLYGSDTRQPTLQASLEKITQTLSVHMVGTLQRLKSRHPEIGSTFDGLIQQGTGKVLHSSGMCHSLSVRFDQQEGWDSGERKAWENLQTHYKDFFTPDNVDRCRANLDLLANTAALRCVLENVRKQKDHIIEQRRAELVRAKSAALEAFRADLLKFTQSKYQEIKNADIDDLKVQRRKLDSLIVVANDALDCVLFERRKEFLDQLKKSLMTDMKDAYGETEKTFVEATEDTIETRTRVRDSMAAKFAEWLWGGGREDYSHKEFKLFLNPVRAGLDDFAEGLSSTLRQSSSDLTHQFRQQLIKEITAAARRHLGDEVDAALIIRSVKGLVSNIEIPQFELDSSELHKLKGTGNYLVDSEARRFLDDAKCLLQNLKGQASCQIRDFIDDIARGLPRSIGNDFFKDMQTRIEQLEEQVSNTLLTLDRLQRMAKDLEAT